MKRQRIVIDLDAPPGSPGRAVGGGKKRKRWPRFLAVFFLFIIAIVVVVGIAGFFLWRHYQSTPSYALALMLDAAQRGDMVEFEKRIDDEQIAKNMAASVTQKAAARYGLALSNPVKQQIETTMPPLLQELRPAIRSEVAKEIQAFASKSKQQPFIFLVIAVPSLMTVTTEGDSAKASALVNDRSFELALRRGADGWKVTDFKDDVLVQRIVDNVMTQLPAIGKPDSKIPIVKPRKRGR